MIRFFPVLALLACNPEESKAIDEDRDGFDSTEDCDDTDPFAFPGAVEHCDGTDTNCDGRVDEAGALGERVLYEDGDGDGFGKIGGAIGCPTQGLTAIPGDCNDSDASIHPGATDDCDGVDQDCDGVVDEDPWAADPSAQWFADDDGDGFGGAPVLSCSSEGLSAAPDDCDDADPLTFPGAEEWCNGLDNDCDGVPDNDPVDATIHYADADQDGFGIDEFPVTACEAPNEFYSSVSGDCDNFDASVFPGAPEWCDGVDTDCDGAADTPNTWLSAEHPSRVWLTNLSPGGLGKVGGDLSPYGNAESFVVADPTCASARVQLPAMVGDELWMDAPWTGAWMYFGGPSVPGSMSFDGDRNVTSDALDAQFDVLRGGLLSWVEVDGAFVASAADSSHALRLGLVGAVDGPGTVTELASSDRHLLLETNRVSGTTTFRTTTLFLEGFAGFQQTHVVEVDEASLVLGDPNVFAAMGTGFLLDPSAAVSWTVPDAFVAPASCEAVNGLMDCALNGNSVVDEGAGVFLTVEPGVIMQGTVDVRADGTQAGAVSELILGAVE